jgi:hypothetical protein
MEPTWFGTWPITFPHIHIYDLPSAKNCQSKPILFADDTSIIIAPPELVGLQNITNDALADLNKFFKTNKLALNVDKTNYINFATRNKTYLG